jgi:two-component system response regulator
LVLLDLKMPGLDRFDVISYVRTRREFAAIAVIVLTSSTEMKDVQRAYDLDANSFIVKETEFNNIITLSKVLKDYWLGINKANEAKRRSRQDSQESDLKA